MEPTSVTPFSAPALERALHAVMASHVRQTGDEEHADSPYPYPDLLLEQLQRVLTRRVARVDSLEESTLRRTFEKRVEQWKRWERTRWETSISAEDVGLLRQAGAYASQSQASVSWPTPMSMRDVDAECQGVITRLYLEGDDEQ